VILVLPSKKTLYNIARQTIRTYNLDAKRVGLLMESGGSTGATFSLLSFFSAIILVLVLVLLVMLVLLH
jgi:hypothetical protein